MTTITDASASGSIRHPHVRLTSLRVMAIVTGGTPKT
jgi:hypothetical protein